MKRKKYSIEVGMDIEEGAGFVAWLRKQGHDARLGNTTGNFIDGTHTSDVEAGEIMRQLWEEYCNQ